MTSTLTKLTDWTYLAHSTLRIRWSYPNPDTPAMALAASSRRWKLIKANPCWKQDEITEPCSVSVQCQQFFKKGKENKPTLSSWYLKNIYTKTTIIKSTTQFSLSLEHLTDNMFVYFLTNRKLNTVVNLPATPSWKEVCQEIVADTLLNQMFAL